MGHIRLGRLPNTKYWRDVAEHLADKSPGDEVVIASAIAAERDFASAASDPIFIEAVRLLALIPDAAKASSFGRSLREIGLDTPDTPQLMDILVAAGRYLDKRSKVVGRSDFGELCQRALIGTLASEIGATLPRLFAPNPADVQSATARLTSTQFGRLARTFFGRLIADTLSYWLDRKLSTHVGRGLGFANATERAGFDVELAQYCSEATRIIHEFASGWHSKTLFREQTVTDQRAAGFGAIAFRKIGEELRRKRQADE